MFSVFETNYRTAAFEFCNIDVPDCCSKVTSYTKYEYDLRARYTLRYDELPCT